MNYITPTIVACVLFALSAAYAGGCGKGNHAHYFQEMASKYFNEMDTNGDGIVTEEKFLASSMAKMIKSFDSLEPNGSGEVAKEAFIQAMVRMNPETKNEA